MKLDINKGVEGLEMCFASFRKQMKTYFQNGKNKLFSQAENVSWYVAISQKECAM